MTGYNTIPLRSKPRLENQVIRSTAKVLKCPL
nr:MAG TPA: hypothetical protein [Caudoviricetes sp.]